VKETRVAEKVIGWLEAQHWEIYQEVKVRSYGGVADIVAVQNGLVWVIECKRSLTLKVLAQARLWRVHFRSIAVPALRKPGYERQTAYDIAKNYLKVGVITVDYLSQAYSINQVVPPPLMREYHQFAKQFQSLLTEEHKTFAKAGQAKGGYWTPYKSTIQACKKFIKDNPGCTMKEMIDYLGRMHYASDKSAIGTLRVNFQTIEKDWVRVDTSERPFRLYIRE
jgi:hypothetical protein